MAELEAPVAAELVARAVHLQLIRTSEKLIVDYLSGKIVAEILAVSPPSDDGCRFTHHVFLAKPEASDVWLRARASSPQYD